MIIDTLPVETLPVGLGAMIIDAVVVHGCTALWVPTFLFEGSFNLIKTSSAHYHTPQSAERRVHPAVGAMSLNHPRRHFSRQSGHFGHMPLETWLGASAAATMTLCKHEAQFHRITCGGIGTP